MKLINKLGLLAAVAMIGLSACEKTDVLPLYADGQPAVLTSSTATVAPPVADSNKTAISFSWNYPKFAGDSSAAKYILEVDSAGRSFRRADVRTITGALSASYLAKELNNIMLNWGFEYNKTYDLEARVTASYANNNDRKVSNVLRIKATTYKIPPKVNLPATGKLFIVGSATEGDWSNPVVTPRQELSKIDETTFGGVFYLLGGSEYLLLPENGKWDKKYSLADKFVTGISAGGSFGADLKDNFPSPSADGWYAITLDFQAGKFTVTPYDDKPHNSGLPQTLVAVGNGTNLGWNNPAVGNTQVFSRTNSVEYSLTTQLIAGGEYLILPEPGNWGKKFGINDNSIESAKLAGTLKREGSNIKAPSTSGKYRIDVNFLTNAYKVTLVP